MAKQKWADSPGCQDVGAPRSWPSTPSAPLFGDREMDAIDSEAWFSCDFADQPMLRGDRLEHVLWDRNWTIAAQNLGFQVLTHPTTSTAFLLVRTRKVTSDTYSVLQWRLRRLDEDGPRTRVNRGCVRLTASLRHRATPSIQLHRTAGVLGSVSSNEPTTPAVRSPRSHSLPPRISSELRGRVQRSESSRSRCSGSLGIHVSADGDERCPMVTTTSAQATGRSHNSYALCPRVKNDGQISLSILPAKQ
ncbi:hypothetical protein VUR80DRAFT_5033 [Thermomyces stellatus]